MVDGGSSSLEPTNHSGNWYPAFFLHPQIGPQDPRKQLLNYRMLKCGNLSVQCFLRVFQILFLEGAPLKQQQ